MRRFVKSTLALFLAGVMAFAPAGEAVAAGNITNDVVVAAETETEEVTVEESSEAETETTAEESSEAETETTVEESSEVETETTVEESSEAETETTAEESSEVETETTVEETSEEETATVEESSEIETETETEAETEEALLPGIENYTLSKAQIESRRQLAVHMSEMAELSEGTDYVAGELVFLAETEEEAEKIAKAYGGTLESFSYGVGVVKLAENVSVMAAMQIAAEAEATSVTGDKTIVPPAWPNYVYKTCTEVENRSTGVEAANTETQGDDAALGDADTYAVAAGNFNDPLLQASSQYYQWQHQMIGSVYAWNAGYTGKGIDIAILDTGVYAHEDLNITANYNFTTDSSASDGNGHGTNVAGLAAAKAGNGIGGAGIAPEANIVNIKVLSDGGYSTSDSVLRGMNAAYEAKVDIVNMSLGGAFYSENEAQIVKKLYDAGIAVFVAAGNDGSMVKAYPAGYKGAICVGAVQQNGGRTYFSNYGSWVKFSAPGYGMYSTGNGADSYIGMSGTSQATPVVSGTAAVILSADQSIQGMSGSAKVDALVKKMNSGIVKGSGGAAGIVSLVKVFKLSTMTKAPSAPTITTKAQTVVGESLEVTIEPKSAADVVYYSTDGKNPTYKNGVLSANAKKYEGAFTIGGSAKVTVKAIAVNACGKASKVVSTTYKFTPLVTDLEITGENVLLKGKSVTLKAAVTPSYAANKKVTWKAVSEELNVTPGGKVTAKPEAVAGQTYKVKAVSMDNGKFEKEFEITVIDAAKVSKVEFKDTDGKAKKKDTVSIAGTDVEYNLGAYLKVTLADNTEGSQKDVTWSTSNKNIATVSNSAANAGVVTVKAAGTVKITAKANDGSGKKADFTLTVKQLATELVIEGTDQIAVGKSAKLTAKILPANTANKKVVWDVKEAGKGVSVKSGKVSVAKTAAAGAYTVTAKIMEGETVAASAEKVINVTDNAIQSIKLDTNKATIFRVAGDFGVDTSVELNATVAAKTVGGAETTSSEIEFTSSNPDIATVSLNPNGTSAVVKATGKAAGTVKITCAATDGSGKKAVCTVKVANPISSITIAPQGGNYGYVAKGKKIKLTVTLGEDFGAIASKKIKWESANKEIATVDSKGNVKGVKEGRVAIYAYTQDGSNLRIGYLVDVTTPFKKLNLAGFMEDTSRIKWTTNIEFNSNEEKGWYYIPVLYDGKTYSDNSGVCPDVAIEIGDSDIVWAEWAIDDEGYIVPGYITLKGKKIGKTTITIKALDGSNVKKTYRIGVIE